MRNLYILTAFVVVLPRLRPRVPRDTTFTHPPMDVFPEWAVPGHEVPAEADPADGERVLRRRPLGPRAARRHGRRLLRARGPAAARRRLPLPRQGRRRLLGPRLSRRPHGGHEAPRARPRPLHDLLLALPRRRRRRQRRHQEVRHGRHADLPRRPPAQDGRGRDLQHDHERQGPDEPLRRQAGAGGPLGGHRLRARAAAGADRHRGRRPRGPQGGARSSNEQPRPPPRPSAIGHRRHRA